VQKEKTYFAITAWNCLKRLKKVEQYLYCSIFPAHIIRWRHKKYLNHCHRRKKEGSSLKKPLICIKKCLLLFWMRKTFVIIQKQYYPAIADVVPYKLHLFIFLAIAISWRPKKMGKFLLAKLVQYSGVSKTRKKSCASYACVKVTCIFNKLNGEPNIVRLLVFLWKNSFVNTNSLQIYTQTCCDHFLSFVDSLYVQDEFTVDLKKKQ
jgi:hypothetical protein